MKLFASNQEIDALLLEQIQTAELSRPLRGLSLAMALHHSGLDLRPAPGGERSPIWQAQEHANRSCQRLREKGLVRYCSQNGWIPAPVSCGRELAMAC